MIGVDIFGVVVAVDGVGGAALLRYGALFFVLTDSDGVDGEPYDGVAPA